MPDTPMPDQPEFDAADPDFDGQDMAEVFDEDNQLTEDRRMAGGDDGFTFEEQPDLYDATRRVGDEDDDEALIGDDMDDSDIVALAGDDDDDDDDLEDDDLRARSADAYDDEDDDELDFDDQDPDLDDKVERLSPEEVELADAGDLANSAHAEGSAKRFESSRLSDEEIDRLGYGRKGVAEVETRSFDPEGERTDDENAKHARQDELLDQGVEETFPASDPVSVKHIT